MPNPFGPTYDVGLPQENPKFKRDTNIMRFFKGVGWVPKSKWGEVNRDKRKLRERRLSREAAAAGTTSPAPTTTTLDLSTPVPVPTIPTPESGATTASSAPSWWNPTIYTNPNAEQQFANAANALLPSLSPEDQRNIANYLSSNFKDVYGGYANAALTPIPTNVAGLREQYLSPNRVQTTLSMLDRVQKAAGGTPGAGYDFLRNALNLMNKFTTAGSPMTREQYEQFTNAVKDMTASVGNDLKAYSNLAQLFNLPSFTAGSLVSNVPLTRLNV